MGTFSGFESPAGNFFRMPNEWVNITADINNLAELKVVEYVLRHTWGFQEYGIAKSISVDEFMHGRKRADGSRMDRGTRLSEQSVRNGVAKAVKDGLLICEIDDSDKARIKKSYALKMQGEVQTLEVKDLDPQNGGGIKDRGQKFRPRTPKSLTSDSQTLDLGVPDVRPRSEKETSERNPLKTPKKDNNVHVSTQTTDKSSSDHRRKSRLLSSATPQVQALINEWKVCYKAWASETEGDGSIRITKTLIDHATTLVVQYGLLPGELAQYVSKMRAKDKKGWYVENGLHLGNVVNEVQKNPPVRDAPVIPGMTWEEFDEVGRDMRSVDLWLLCAQDEETGRYFIGIADSDTTQIDINRPEDWYHLPDEKLTQALAYAQSVQKTA
jgi:DNA-binding PadR family transcriptional regulator